MASGLNTREVVRVWSWRQGTQRQKAMMAHRRLRPTASYSYGSEQRRRIRRGRRAYMYAPKSISVIIDRFCHFR